MVKNLTKYDVLVPFTSFESYHLRELARFFGKHHYTISRHLSALMQENVIKMEKRGRENIFSLNLNNPLTLKHLEIAENIKLISFIEELQNNLKSLFHDILSLRMFDMCVLFGSYAKKTYDIHSDIDLLIIPSYKRVIELESELTKLSKRWGVVISPIYLTWNDLRKNLMEKDETTNEILRSHVCLVGVEKFLKEVVSWI